MKLAINFLGIILAGAGLVWALQGANVLPGSFMTGQPFWLVTGIGAFIVGAGILYLANRRSEPPPPIE